MNIMTGLWMYVLPSPKQRLYYFLEKKLSYFRYKTEYRAIRMKEKYNFCFENWVIWHKWKGNGEIIYLQNYNLQSAMLG